MQRKFIVLSLASILILGAGLSACAKNTSSKSVSAGSVVTLNYALIANNEALVKDSAPETMKLTVGQGKLPALFEKSLIGLPVGSAKAIILKPEEAYGPVRKELIARVPRTAIPAGDIHEGMILNAGGSTAKLVKILDDGTVVLDRNHPLAGKNLLYKVRIISIQ